MDLQLIAFERADQTILRPSHPVMDVLREQLEASSGPIANSLALASLPACCSCQCPGRTSHQGSLHLGEVAASLTGLDHGAGRSVGHRRRIDTLEGYSYGEPWPDRDRGLERHANDPISWRRRRERRAAGGERLETT